LNTATARQRQLSSCREQVLNGVPVIRNSQDKRNYNRFKNNYYVLVAYVPRVRLDTFPLIKSDESITE
jgi:hypothetical protein